MLQAAAAWCPKAKQPRAAKTRRRHAAAHVVQGVHCRATCTHAWPSRAAGPCAHMPISSPLGDTLTEAAVLRACMAVTGAAGRAPRAAGAGRATAARPAWPAAARAWGGRTSALQ